MTNSLYPCKRVKSCNFAKKMFIFAFAMLLSGSMLRAATVDEATAKKVAANVLGVSESQLVNRTTRLYSSSWRTHMFLFIPQSGTGFALISANDYAMPVLGYSTTAVFDSVAARNSYSGIYQWLANCYSQLNTLKGGSYAASAAVTAAWTQLRNGAPAATTTAIAPMLTTKWDQTGDYALRTPMSSAAATAVHCPTGGAAVAMAQVMKYYGLPERGTDTTYSYTNSGSWSTTVSVNFDTVYNYANMPNQLTASSTAAQKAAVSHLLYHCGASVRMRYYQNYTYMYSSGGNPIANALKNYFNFHTTTTYLQFTTTYYTTWTTKLRDELVLGRPVIYTGGSHLNFVIDGCDSWGNFHFNWGQGGLFDGYFVVGSLNPGSYNYNNTYQYAVIGIAPKSEEPIVITGAVNNAAWGKVLVNGQEGRDTVTKYETITLRADSARTEEFTARFVRWSDGETANPRTHYAVADKTFTAEFERYENVTITGVPNNEDWGSTSGSGVYAPFDVVTLRATPVSKTHFSTRFLRWSDGDTKNPTSFYAGDESVTYTAIFEYIPHVMITAEANNPDWGSVSGSGGYPEGTRVTLTATPTTGATFERWADGSTANPRYIVVGNSDQRFVANFSFAGQVTITGQPSNASHGSVSGSGQYLVGDSVYLTAVPASGYTFSRWSDNSTQNPRRLKAATDLTLTATFATGGTTVAAQTPNNPVTLDDRESHAWSYYSDPDNPVRSLNPADVKFTYFGYGTRTMYSSNAATPTGAPDQNVAASAVGIGIDAPAKNAYVYYKTLERHGGTTARSVESSTGPCKYHVMHNPFSIRPTYGSGDTRWRGFYKWRVRRLVGGALFADRARTQMIAQGQMVDADQEIWVDPAAEYGMEVEFEAIWARAFIFPPTGPMEGINDTLVTDAMRATGTNAYERNFVVLTADNIASITNGSETTLAYNVEPLTITAIYPDGTNGTSSTRLTAVPTGVALNQHFICMADTKFEYININAPTKAFIGNGFNFAMGRGIAIPSDTTNLRKLVGMSAMRAQRNYSMQYTIDTIEVTTTDTVVNAPGDTTFTSTTTTNYDTTDSWRVYRIDHVSGDNAYNYEDGNFVIRIESGCYKDLLPLYGGIYTYYLNSDWTSNANSARPGTGNQPTIYDNVGATRLWTNYAIFGSDYDRSVGENNLLSVTNYLQGSYGGFLNRAPIPKETEQYRWVVKSGNFLPGRLGYGQGGTTTFYISSVGTAYWSYGTRRTIDIEGGLIPGVSGGQDWSTGNYVDPADTNIWIRVRGGHVRSIIHGAGEYAAAKGVRRIVITGGTINGWVAGGCNGSRTDGGDLNGDAYVYIGGKAQLVPSAADPFINSSQGGNVYGAGSGNANAAGTTATVGKVNNSAVVIADSCYIARNVYGGGNYGGVIGGGSKIYLLGGTVEGKVFGGANQQGGKQVDIVMRGGVVKGGVYGGSNLLGHVSGPVSVRVEGGTVGYEGCPDSLGNVFGSGYGEQTRVMGSVEVVVGNKNARRPHVNNPTIYNNVYGGGYAAPYNSVGNEYRVTTWNGEVKGSIFGGGLGTTAVIRGDTRVGVFGTTTVLGNVYGGGNMGKISGNANVVIGEDGRTYTLTVESNNTTMGAVEGGGDYLAGSEVRISATPASGHWFRQWSDGNIENPRTVTVTGNETYTAQFEAIINYTITATANDGTMGTVSGGGSYPANQAISLSATANEGYRFLRWNDGSTDNPRTVIVTGAAAYTAVFEAIPAGWVDLGLPSGLLWTECNLGATAPEQYGNYYAWGETTTKSTYNWDSYKYHTYVEGTLHLTKYVPSDELTTLQPGDDVATQLLGPEARIPTMTEWLELLAYTTVTNETLNGVAGRRFTSTVNGKSFFVPYTGYKTGSSTSSPGTCTYFWTSTVSPSSVGNAVDIYIDDTYADLYDGNNGEGRYYGFPIRAVRQ